MGLKACLINSGDLNGFLGKPSARGLRLGVFENVQSEVSFGIEKTYVGMRFNVNAPRGKL